MIKSADNIDRTVIVDLTMPVSRLNQSFVDCEFASILSFINVYHVNPL
jgi:predicted 2-oxoglutarate/Fe(II)-dependent dioxygenase YbiX